MHCILKGIDLRKVAKTSGRSSLWKAKPSNRFKSGYKNLSDEMAERVDSALKSLLSEESRNVWVSLKKQVGKAILHMNWGEAAE